MQKLLFDIIKTFILAAILFFLVQTLIQNYQVFGASMEPNIESGEHIIVNKAAYITLDIETFSKVIPFYDPGEGSQLHLFGKPQRGDVVVVKSPQPPPENLVKRIVAIPQDSVEIRAGSLYVNGYKITESYTKGISPNLSRLTIPQDHYYLLGDNRDRSNDSKNFGPVHKSQIIGKAWLAYWPLNHFGTVQTFAIEPGPER